MAETKAPRTRARTSASPPKASGAVAEAEVVSAAVAEAPTGAVVGGSPLGALPIGLGTSALAADVSGQLQAVAPTFGSVLSSIGIGVADSQTALDKGVVDTVNELSDTNITVVTDVIQHLDDDGLPDTSLTELVSTDLSVLNFFMPTVHEWKRVAISMDLSVGAFSETDGVQFNAEQQGGGVGGAGLFWGFVGVSETTSYDNDQMGSRTHQQEASWSAGEVRLDATLGPRTTGTLPVASQVSVGPQIVFSQGATKEVAVAGAGVNRSVDVLITVLKAAGDPNPTKPVTVTVAGLRTAFSSTAPFTGNVTNPNGQLMLTVTRNVPNAGAGAINATLIARLGAFTQSYNLTI